MLSSPDSYAPGSMVFEPLLGLCTVLGWTEEKMLGVQQRFCELKSLDNSSVVKIPSLKMLSRGIRPLMAPIQIECALQAEDKTVASTTVEHHSQRIRRWTQRLRCNRSFGGYEFLREWQSLEVNGARFNERETDFHKKILRALTQEVAQVLQLSASVAGLRVSSWLGALPVSA